MKKIIFSVLGALLIGLSGLYAQSTTIHCWDFNDATAPANDFLISPLAITQRVTGNGTITHNFDQVANFGGNTANACSGSAAGGSFCPQGGLNTSNNGAFMELAFPTTGFEQVQFSFWSRRTGTGFDSVAVSYSTNGVAFTNFGSYSANTTSSGNVETFDFSAIAGANDNADFKIRLTFFGATSQSGNNRLDNITLTGTPAAVGGGLTNPTPFDLSTGNYTFDNWASTAAAGTYPASMAFWYTFDPSATWFDPTAEGAEDYNCSYDLTSRPRFNGLGSNGISLISTGSPQRNDCSGGAADTSRYAGSIVLNLNTTGRGNINVSWFNEILNTPGRDFTFRLQYRFDNTGNFIDVPGTIEFNTTGKVQNDTASLSTMLPSALENQANLQLRWAYFQVAAGSGTRPEIRFDNLVVTSDAATPAAPTYAIADIKGVDAQGVADSLNVTCAITGLVSGGNLRSSGVEFWMVSPTNDAGVLVRNTNFNGYTVAEGDELYVHGSVSQFRGLIQFVPDSIHVISSNNALPAPAEVFSLGEATEGRLITIKNVDFVAGATWPTGSANRDIFNATDTFLLRINAATGIPSNPAPTGPFDLVGHGGQFNPSTSAPFLSGYQILPRSIADFQPASGTTTYTIADITTVDAAGVADSLGVSCAITGLVSGDNLRSSGVEFWFISPNNDAGLLVRNTNFTTYTVTEGDALYISGTVSQFRGLIQFNPDSIHVISANNTLPAPDPITTLDESTEGRLVTFPFLTLLSGWSPSGSGFNALVTDGTNNFTVRVSSATTMFTLPAPTTPFSLVGHGGQFNPSTTAPFLSGYQLQPRYASDLTPIIPATPTVNFITGTTSHLENAGTVPVTMVIDPVSANAETLFVTVTEDANIQPGDYTTTPAATAGVITVTVPANADTVSFDLNIVDNTIQNPNKNLTFAIDSATAGLTIGAISNKVVTIVDDDIVIPTYLIQDVAGVDAQGVADSLGVMCKLEGVVLGVDLSGAAAPALQFTLHNGTKGIGVFANAGKAIPYTVTEGDELRIIGTLSQFRGLLQIEPDSIVVISTGNPLPTTPQVVTALGENTESELIRVNGVSIVDPSQWTNSGSGMSVDVSDGVNTFVMRVDNDVDLFGSPVPTGVFDVVGIGGQFNPSSSAPFTSGYQILPRYIADIIYPALEPLAVTEIMPGSNDPVAALRGDWFEITNTGTDPVTLDGFSWDNDTETPGITTFPNGVTIAAGEAIVILDIDAADTTAWKANWRIAGQALQIITRADLTGPFPNIKQGGDLVALYNVTGNELCRAFYLTAVAGRSVEFDNQCLIIGNATNGVRGAYFSNGGDQGSPGNLTPSISTENIAISFAMYPNPARNEVKIDFSTAANRTVEVMNTMGAVLLNTQVKDANVRLDVATFAAGVYFVRITENGAVATRRLIVE